MCRQKIAWSLDSIEHKNNYEQKFRTIYFIGVLKIDREFHESYAYRSQVPRLCQRNIHDNFCMY